MATHGTPSRRGQRGAGAVARAVVAEEGPLELDPQPVGPEGVEQAPRGGLVVDAAAGAAAQADQALGVIEHGVERRLAGPTAGAPGRPSRVRACARVIRIRQRLRQPRCVLDQQREVAAVVEVDLGAVDRPQPERARRLRELHRAATSRGR